MIFILISFLVLMLLWMMFDSRYIFYVSFSPPTVFFAYNNYLYGTVMAFFMFYFIINHLELEQDSNKNGTLYKKIIAGILFAILPVMSKLSASVRDQKRVTMLL